MITSLKTIRKKQKKDLERVCDEIFKLISTFDHYVMDCNRYEKRLQEYKESNTGLKLKLKTTRAGFKNAFNYYIKESNKIE